MSLRRLIKAMFSSPKPPARPATTTVHIALKDGAERFFRYPGILKGWPLDMRLDAVMDEMDEGTIESPVRVFRDFGDGTVKREEITIYSPIEDM